MQITTVTWIMALSLIGTQILLNILESRQIKKSVRRLAKDRRHFSYTYHIPERRTRHEIKKSERRFEKDRRHFSYATHIPERRSGDDRRLSYNG